MNLTGRLSYWKVYWFSFLDGERSINRVAIIPFGYVSAIIQRMGIWSTTIQFWKWLGYKRIGIGLLITGAPTQYWRVRVWLGGEYDVNLPDWPSWALTTVVALCVVGYFLFRRLQEIEGLLQPKIKLSVAQKEGYRVSINAEYVGDGSAESAKVVLWSVEDEEGNLVQEMRESLALSATGNEVTPLRPGEPKAFHVAKLSVALYRTSSLELGYIVRLDDQGKDQNDLDRSLAAGTYHLNLRAVSRNTQATIEKYRLSYTDDWMKLTLSRIPSNPEQKKWLVANIFPWKKPAARSS